jgi:hypothetical protein
MADRWRNGGLVTLVVAAVLLAAGPPAAAQGATGTVTVVHAVEGLQADVYLDGSDTPALSGFEYQKVTDPMAVPVGVHTAAVYEAGADPATAQPVVTGSFEVEEGADISVVAQRDAAGTPSLVVFDNAVPPLAPGQAQLWVRHVAVAPPVDVLVDGQPTFDEVSNGSVKAAVVPAGSREVTVRGATDGAVLVEPRTLDVTGAEALYLVGSSDDDTLTLLAQTPATSPAAGSGGVPTGVPGGDSGLLPAGGGSSAGGWLLALAATALVIGLRSRRRSPTAGS